MKYAADIMPPYPLSAYPRLIINAAITGMVATRDDSPHVPLTTGQIIQDAVDCRNAGAAIIHLHARDEDMRPTYKKEIYQVLLEGIRRRCPDLILCVSTSGRFFSSFAHRSEVLDLTGSSRPDMASLSLGSLNFPAGASVTDPEMIQQLAEKMRQTGILPELEIFDSGMLYTMKEMIRRQVLRPPYYCNLILGSTFSTAATVHQLSSMVKDIPDNVQWAGGGIGPFQLKMNLAAILMGGHVRVGLEDNLYYDSARTIPATNPRLIERITRLAGEIGREVASPAEARSLLGFASDTAP
ncbi:MAG: 3-keto-5-aminohexanoate cleavage protein [Desulfosudaceae bacterium]